MRVFLFIVCITFLLFSCAKESETDLGVRYISHSTHKLSSGTGTTTTANDYFVEIFPMPFVDSTTVQIEIDNSSPLTLTITDENGKFYQVVNQFFDAGTHQIGVRFNNFPEGVYMMEMELGNLADRFQLIKVEQ